MTTEVSEELFQERLGYARLIAELYGHNTFHEESFAKYCRRRGLDPLAAESAIASRVRKKRLALDKAREHKEGK